MRTDPSPTPERPGTDPVTGPATPPPGPAPDRADAIEHLFRYASRAGQVHPLQHLLQRYRAGERA